MTDPPKILPRSLSDVLRLHGYLARDYGLYRTLFREHPSHRLFVTCSVDDRIPSPNHAGADDSLFHDEMYRLSMLDILIRVLKNNYLLATCIRLNWKSSSIVCFRSNS